MSRRMASDERPNIRDAKGPEIDRPASELLGEEPVDMPRVVVDCCTIQPTFFPQVHTVLVCQAFRWAGCDRFPLLRDYPYIAQNREQQP
jgi:hypothetical protein